VLRPDEVLTAVRIPAIPDGWRGNYSKSRERTAGDFAVASLALGFDASDGTMRGVRVVLGGVAPTPLRVREVEAALEGNAPTDAVASAAADVLAARATPLDHNGYKVDLLHALLTRGVARVAAG